MAHHKSSKKRIRSDARKNVRNRSYMSGVRTAVKKLKSAAQAGQTGEAVQKLFVEAQSQLHKAASKGLLHRNNAARRVARLAQLIVRTEAK